MQNNGLQLKIIGLTGRSGSGKTAVSQILENYHAYIIDCDRIAHDLLKYNQKAIEEVAGVFGGKIFDSEGNVDRKKISAIVFSNKELLKIHTKITHRYIIEEIMAEIKEIQLNPKQFKYIVIDAPLLIEADLHKICHSVWVVYADDKRLVKRIMERDKIDEEGALKRLRSQMPFDKLREYADVFIKNEGNIDELRNEVEKHLKYI